MLRIRKFVLYYSGGEHEPNILMSNLNQTGYMDTHGQPPTTDSVYGLSHYYTSQNPAAAAASESWKNHQEQYSSSYISTPLTTKEEFARDVENRYHHSSIGGAGPPNTVPQASSSPYSSESQSLSLWNRSSSAGNDEIGECSRGATTYDCY